MKKVLSVLFVLGLVVFSCKKDKAEEPIPTTTTTVSFATDVQPIFQQSCGTGGSCHGSSSGADGKVYETFAGASAVPDATTLGAIKHTAGFKPMPQGLGQLSSANISIIESWINGGKKND